MNRQTVTIFAALMAAVLVVLGIAVYLQRGGTDAGRSPIAGPGRASEARELIADIQERRANEADAPAARPAVGLINAPAESPGQPVADGAIAVTPVPVQAAPSGAGAELDAAFERARELQAAGQLDDAQVLFFFGARQGHARSAYAYAEMNDPNYHSSATSLLAEPDAFQAYRWYSAALEGGIDEAAARLDALREWTEAAAAAGDAEAERLLLQWE